MTHEINLDLFDKCEENNYPCFHAYIKEVGQMPSMHSMDLKKVDCLDIHKVLMEEYKAELVFKESGSDNSIIAGVLCTFGFDGDVAKGVKKEMSGFRFTYRIANKDGIIYINLYYKSSRQSGQIKFFYPLEQESFVESACKNIKENCFKNTGPQAAFSILSEDYGELTFKDIEIDCFDIDLSLNYGLDFPDKHEVIVTKIKQKGGLYIFHGVAGSGKTTYLKYLSKLVPERKFAYIPTNMTEMLNKPQLSALLMDHPNTILVIEDSEKVVRSREDGDGNDFVSTILNLSDGILTSILGCSVILTFNTSKDNIDKALLRKGRLKYDYHFGELNKDDAQRLIDHLGFKYRAAKDMTLAEIYCLYDDIGLPTEEKEERKIGFF